MNKFLTPAYLLGLVHQCVRIKAGKCTQLLESRILVFNLANQSKLLPCFRPLKHFCLYNHAVTSFHSSIQYAYMMLCWEMTCYKQPLPLHPCPLGVRGSNPLAGVVS